MHALTISACEQPENHHWLYLYKEIVSHDVSGLEQCSLVTKFSVSMDRSRENILLNMHYKTNKMNLNKTSPLPFSACHVLEAVWQSKIVNGWVKSEENRVLEAKYQSCKPLASWRKCGDCLASVEKRDKVCQTWACGLWVRPGMKYRSWCKCMRAVKKPVIEKMWGEGGYGEEMRNETVERFCSINRKRAKAVTWWDWREIVMDVLPEQHGKQEPEL